MLLFRQEFVCEGIVRFGSKWTLVGRECFQCIEGMIGPFIYFLFSLLSFVYFVGLILQ